MSRVGHIFIGCIVFCLIRLRVGNLERERRARSETRARKENFLKKRLDEVLKNNCNKLPLSKRLSRAKAKQIRSIDWLQSHSTQSKDGGDVSDSSLFDGSSGWYTRRQLHNKLDDLKRRISSYKVSSNTGCLFITFTIADDKWEHGLSFDDAWEKISKRFHVWSTQFSRWAKNEFGVKVEYFKALEVQKKTGRNYPHYHLLVFGLPVGFTRQFFKGSGNWERENRKFQDWWGLGFVDAVEIADRGQGLASAGANYMLKYLYKQAKEISADDLSLSSVPDWFLLPSVFNRRRYSFSRGFAFTAFERLPMWCKRFVASELLQMDLGSLLKSSRVSGFGGWRLDFDKVSLFAETPFKVVAS